MCGIVAYIGEKNAYDILLEGLERLEYRGYDSAGLALLDESENIIKTVRSVGKLKNLREKTSSTDVNSKAGIGHTRWATHGKPTSYNAHPHVSKGLALVHNGIIENYLQLKKELKDKGYIFQSETDSEVIAHLIHSYLNGDILEAVRKATNKLNGAFSVAVITEEEPDRIIAARNDSPLVLGAGEDENFAASDIPAVLSHTRNFIFMEDGDIAVLKKDSIEIYDKNHKKVERDKKYIDWNPVMAEKAGFRHFMQKEIYEQPRAVTDTLRGKYSLEESLIRLPELDEISEKLKEAGRIHIVACGTSWHAGLVGKFLLEKFAGVPVEVDIASEYRYRDTILDENVIFLAITQSGETADTLAAMRMAKKKGCSTLAICNVLGSSVSREADGVIYTHAGPEIGVASTKAFTTQLTCLYMLGIYLGQIRNTINEKSRSEYIHNLLGVPEQMEYVLNKDNEIENIAKDYKDYKDFLFLGRHLNYPVALEGALKLKEISYIHAEGYPAGEMKHGPIALIDENMPVFTLATNSRVYDKIVSNIEEVKARDGIVIATVTENDASLADKCDAVISIPESAEEVSVFLNTVVTQFFAYHCARLLGNDVDQPRNLAKSVTVE